MRSFSVSREGDAITCSFPYPFRAFGRNYIANVTAENEGFSAEVPELPGCLTEAYSMDELKRNLPEAVECWLGGAEDLSRAQGRSPSPIRLASNMRAIALTTPAR